jgi:hypothetical protein
MLDWMAWEIMSRLRPTCRILRGVTSVESQFQGNFHDLVLSLFCVFVFELPGAAGLCTSNPSLRLPPHSPPPLPLSISNTAHTLLNADAFWSTYVDRPFFHSDSNPSIKYSCSSHHSYAFVVHTSCLTQRCRVIVIQETDCILSLASFLLLRLFYSILVFIALQSQCTTLHFDLH